MSKAATVKDIAPAKFIAAYAAHLKKGGKVALPSWVDHVKTAPNKELAPLDNDWYYIRAAAIARRVYLVAGHGVGYYQRVFGSPRREGPTPVRQGSSSGSIIRHVFKNLEKMGLIEKDAHGYV